MTSGRSPRNPIIGDTVLLRAQKIQGIGTIVDADAIGYKVYWRKGPGETFLACPRRVGRPATRLWTGMAMTYHLQREPVMAMPCKPRR